MKKVKETGKKFINKVRHPRQAIRKRREQKQANQQEAMLLAEATSFPPPSLQPSQQQIGSSPQQPNGHNVQDRNPPSPYSLQQPSSQQSPLGQYGTTEASLSGLPKFPEKLNLKISNVSEQANPDSRISDVLDLPMIPEAEPPAES